MTRKSLALTLIAGAVMTLMWTSSCPRYKLVGQSYTIEEAPAVTSPKGYQHEGFWHADPAKFTGGLVVIWSSLFGAVLWYPSVVEWIKTVPIAEEAKRIA